MAGDREEEREYESDPEEAKISLTMRRREASDDEEEEEEDDGDDRGMPPRRIDSRPGIVSDYDSDVQGAAADYEDEESETEEEEVEDEENQYEERIEEAEVVATEVVVEFDDVRRYMGQSMEVHELNQIEEEKKENEAIAQPIEGEYYASNESYLDNAGGIGEDEKKENEPFAVPTAGTFYMHDDRFRDSAGGRHRRTSGGRKLWESRDDKKWGHDKFEEMTMQERHYEEGRKGSRGRYRARSKNRGEDGGYPRPNRSKAYNNNNQNYNGPRGVRGRGPRRYQPSTMNNSEASTQNRQPGKSVEKTSYRSSGRVSTPASNVESDPVPVRGNVFASSLSSASPPFYPSGSSNKEIGLTQKRDSQSAPINRNLQSGTMRGKNVTDSIPMDKLYIDDSVSSFTRKPLNNMQLSQSESSLMNSTQSRGVQGRGTSPSGQMAYQTSTPHNPVNRASPPTQLHTVQRAPVQGRPQASVQASSGQQQRPGSGSQVSSPPKAALSVHSFDSGETEALSESKPKTALVGKGKGSVQGSGRGSFLYGGAQVMGGDQNFPGTTAFLPVMQFGGQRPGGMGVPAVGMAFPGYVAQPQLGLGNSEMTWLPVLAGAAGALGATYCPPYLAVDGAYHHGRPTAQSSSLSSISSKENSTSRPSNELKSSQRAELVNDEFGRQNKPRRYTEMKFDQ